MERCLGCDNSLVTEPKIAVAMTAGGANEIVAIDTEVLDTRARQNEIMTKMISSGVDNKLRRDDDGQVIITTTVTRHDPGDAHRRHQTMDGTRLFNQWFDDYSHRDFEKIFVVREKRIEESSSSSA